MTTVEAREHVQEIQGLCGKLRSDTRHLRDAIERGAGEDELLQRLQRVEDDREEIFEASKRADKALIPR